jgi:hypothetical protein
MILKIIKGDHVKDMKGKARYADTNSRVKKVGQNAG